MGPLRAELRALLPVLYPQAPSRLRANSLPGLGHPSILVLALDQQPREGDREAHPARSRTPPKDPQRRRPKPRSTVSSDSAAVANSLGALIDAFFKTTDAAAPRVYRARCAFDIPCPPLSHAIRLVRHTRPALRLSSVQTPEQCIAPGLNPASAVPHRASALQVGPILVLPRAPAHSSLRRGPQFATPCQLTAQRNAMGRRPLCDRHAIRVVHLPSFCFDRCSHCQSLTRFCVSRLGLCSGPLLRSCHPRTTQSLLPLAITQRKPPPFSTRTRSWQPLIQQPARLCYKEWPSGQPELRVVRYLVRQYRYHCMVPSREHLLAAAYSPSEQIPENHSSIRPSACPCP